MAMEFLAVPTRDLVQLRIFTDNVAASTVEVSRTMVGSTTPLRAAAKVTPGTPSVWAAADIEVLYNTPITYSALIRDAAGIVVESDTAGPVTVAQDSAFLRDVLFTSSKMPVRLVGQEAGDYETDVRRELLRPLGRRAAVVITDVRSAANGTTSILTMSAAEQKQLTNLLNSGRVLMFTGPATNDIAWPLYIHFGKVSVSRVGESLSEARLWGLEWVEVDPPPVGLYDPVVAQTWQKLADADTQWSDIYQTMWIDVIYPVTTTVVRAA